MELNNKVAIVTGGTGGLGSRICRAFAQNGIRVAVCYAESKSKAEDIASELKQIGNDAIAVQVDQTQETSIKKMVDDVLNRLGPIDILINDAAYNKPIPFNDLEKLNYEDWTKILSVNLDGPFLCSKAVAPIMKEIGSGRIINIASGSGLYPSGASIAYCVSKAALIHLTRCLAVALSPEVLVNCVAPGFMEGTRATAGLPEERKRAVVKEALLKRAVDKDDIAQLVVDFCRTESLTGQTLVVDAGRVFH